MRTSEITNEALWTVREAAAFLRLGSRIRFQPSTLRRWLAVQVDLSRRT